MNGVAQDPGMEEYQGVFNDAYILRGELCVEVPAEFRLCCNCTAASFVGELQPDHQEAIDNSCTACSKLWCMRRGDLIGPSAPSLGPVSHHSNLTYCKDTGAIKEAARQKLDALAFSRALPRHCIPAHFLRPCSVVPKSTTC
jgi:hypothetical protein